LFAAASQLRILAVGSRESEIMRSFVAACIAAIVIAIGSAVVLNGYQKPAIAAFSTSGVRI
jgi:hypothetical protein